MIEQFLNRDYLLAVAEGAQVLLTKEAGKRKRRSGSSVLADYSTTELRELDDALGRIAGELGEPEPEPGEGAPPPREDYVFLPHHQLMAILQSSLEEAIAEKSPTNVTRPSATGRGRRGAATPVITGSSLKGVKLQENIGNRRAWRPMEVATGKWVWLSDPLWAMSLVNKIWRDVHTGNHRFVDNPATIKVANDAVLIVIGDWGSGLPRARLVADQVAKELARDPHRQKVVIHLGDVYYSGTEREFRERFLDPWPVQKGSDVISLTLPGNHELYSGGFAYFDVGLADPRFARQQGCSYFAVETDHWQFLGLDTAYEDAGLHGGQAEWARDRIARAPALRTCLLSHHQLFSAHETRTGPLQSKIEPVLATERVDAWLWGHEHRCIQYAPTIANGHRVGFASCLGHGGIPEYLVMKEGQTARAPWAYEYLKRYNTNGLEPWGMFGFAALDLHDEHLGVRYIDENGHEHHRVSEVGSDTT